jgi:hypothetical protein
MNEEQILEQLRSIGAQFAGMPPNTLPPAIDVLPDRVDQRPRSVEEHDPPVEIRFSLRNQWSRRLFLALARRHGLAPYRYRGQRHTTVVLKAPQSFIDETLWPEFERIDQILSAYLSHVTDRLISQVFCDDLSEAPERSEQPVAGTPPAVATATTDANALVTSGSPAAVTPAATSPTTSRTTTSPAASPTPSNRQANRAHARKRKKNRKLRRKKR